MIDNMSLFTILEEHASDIYTMQCSQCSEVFDIDLINQANIIVRHEWIDDYLIKCPTCGIEDNLY